MKEVLSDEKQFFCDHCKINVNSKDEDVVKVNIYETDEYKQVESEKLFVEALLCPKCAKYVAINFVDEWNTIENSLKFKGDVIIDGFKWVETQRERIILWLLNQVCYHQLEEASASSFLPTSSSQAAKILWLEGQAVGFYTLHQKGDQLRDFPQACYSLPIIDLVYVKENSRRMGLATRMLDDIRQEYSNQDIGFSSPVSPAMYEVFRKYLKKNTAAKDHFWEVTWTGDEGYRKSVWFETIRLFNSKRKREYECNTDRPSKVS